MERLETVPRMTGVEEGLAARVHDPLWLLARQFQFGEFTAENAASVAWVDVEAEYHRLDRLSTTSGELELTFDVATEPLERLVEQELPLRVDVGLRTDGGVRWARQLNAAGLGRLLPAFTAPAPLEPDPLPGSPAALVRSRVPDGVALAATLAALIDPATAELTATGLGLPAEVRDEVARAAAAWLGWWRARVPEDAPDLPAEGHPITWDVHRMEHGFSLSSSTLPHLVLTANGYGGGRLDWWAVDALSFAPSPEEPGGPPTPVAVRGVPAPARFGGMPVPRFWEMEDARFDPGAIDASPNDLGRLLLTTFATVYGNDWFVLPMRLPVGTISRITSFTVTDVFGGTRTLSASGADVDGWNLFGLSDAGAQVPPGVERPTSPWFYLAPSMPNGLQGPAFESVLLLRDEMANLAWAVETHVRTPSGVVMDRGEQWAAHQPEPEPPGPLPRYRVDTVVPEHWYPLAPEQLADQQSVRLRLAPLARVDEARSELPRGRLLSDEDGTPGRLWLFEEEVPRAGVVVERRAQHARWHDGSVHCWTARSKRTGRGEGASGLRFDVVEP